MSAALDALADKCDKEHQVYLSYLKDPKQGKGAIPSHRTVGSHANISKYYSESEIIQSLILFIDSINIPTDKQNEFNEIKNIVHNYLRGK